MIKRVLLVGRFGPGALEKSYSSAFRGSGLGVEEFDIESRMNANCRGGKAGRFFNLFVPVEKWLRKATREFLLKALDTRPDLVVVFGQNLMSAGALAQLYAAVPGVRTALIWPDTMNHLGALTVAAVPLYDVVGSYSRASLEGFRRLGARNPRWLPLGADPQMHGRPAVSGGKDLPPADLSFVGGWQPEREHVLERAILEFPRADVRIYGPDWGRRCRNRKVVLPRWQGRALWEDEFAACIEKSKLSLNVIDRTNFPAANMRFFEIPCAGGAQVSTECPEMEKEFVHGETVMYVKSDDDIGNVIGGLLEDDAGRQRIAAAGKELVMAGHTYSRRVETLLSWFGEMERTSGESSSAGRARPGSNGRSEESKDVKGACG